MERQSAHAVVQQLLDEMIATVRNYHCDVGRTGATVDELIQSTAFFPGGCGLWRGNVLRGPMPEYFPDTPIMFIAHNYDSTTAHERYKGRGGEVDSFFWHDVLIPYMKGAGIDPTDVFFTNALMGCKPGSATGPMPSVPGYEQQCLKFLCKQIGIVNPRIVIALGGDARVRLRRVVPKAQSVMHPSARQFKARETRAARISKQAVRLSELIRRAPGWEAHAIVESAERALLRACSRHSCQ